MAPNAKIIICAAVPTWLRAELSKKSKAERDKLYRGLNYIAHDVATRNCRGARVCAVLSGDMHHYSRYSGQRINSSGRPDEDSALACQFITSGGGGAFLHPTHQLLDSFKMGWLGRTHEMSLETEPSSGHPPSPGTRACYPNHCTSRLLLLRNFAFPIVNYSFCLVLGAIYWIAALLLLAGQSEVLGASSTDIDDWSSRIFDALVHSPMLWTVYAVLSAILFVYADARSLTSKIALGATHSALHLGLIATLVCFLPAFNVWATSWLGFSELLSGWFVPGTLSFFWLFLIEVVLIGGLVGGFVWGCYLMLTCGIGGIHDNDAFSAMRLGLYRHFLRLRIEKDKLTIYPIGLDHPPSRNDWRWNPARKKNNQSEPEVLPSSQLKCHLIEDPIVVRAPESQPPIPAPSPAPLR